MAEKTFTSEEHDATLVGEGIKLMIPHGATAKGTSLKISLRACINGPFELPDNISLASPVFLITPHCNFDSGVILTIEHFINLRSEEDCKNMVFLTCTETSKPAVDKDGPYWKLLEHQEKPKCTVASNLGVVNVKSLCFFGLGWWRSKYLH